MMPLGSEIVPSSRQTYPVQSPQTLQENVPTPPSGLVFTDVDTQTSTAVIRSTSDMKLRSCSCKVKVKCQVLFGRKAQIPTFYSATRLKLLIMITIMRTELLKLKVTKSRLLLLKVILDDKWACQHARGQTFIFYSLFRVCHSISCLCSVWSAGTFPSSSYQQQQQQQHEGFLSSTVCQRPYVTQNMASLHGSPQWLHPTDSMIAMTACTPHTHTALYLRGRSLTSDTSWLLTHRILIPSSYSPVQKWGTNSCNIRPI